MSFIERELFKRNNSDIEDYLLKEGFEYGTGAQGEGYMYYVASFKTYTVWIALCENYISLYAEYECGGCVGKSNFRFGKDNFESFLEAYEESVEWTKEYM